MAKSPTPITAKHQKGGKPSENQKCPGRNLGTDGRVCGRGCNLIPEPYLQKMPTDVQARLHDIDGMDVNYNYGGQPDRCLDIVTDADHYAIQQLMEGQNESR